MNRTRFASALAMAALAAILLPSSLHAQITFQRTYGGASVDRGFSVQQTSDGGYVITGYTGSFGAGGGDVYLIKTDSIGDTLWTRTFGGAGVDHGSSVQQTADGGYIVAGFTSSFGAGNYDAYLVKTNAAGGTLWTRTYGGTNFDEAYSVEQATDGGYILAGMTKSYGAGGDDVYLIKTDSIGDTLWTRTFGGADVDHGSSVQQTADGGYIVAGYTSSFGAFVCDAYEIKTDASGDTEWTRIVGGTDYTMGSDVRQTKDGGYIVAGIISYSGGPDHVYLVRSDAAGNTLWTRAFGGAHAYVGCSIRQTTDGGFIVAGYEFSVVTDSSDVYLLKTNANGDTLWTRTFGDIHDDEGYSVTQTSDGGYIIAGYTNSFGAGSYDVYLIKTDSFGNVASVAEPKASPTRVSALSLTCEPNPFRTRTAISLQLTANSPAALAIFDASGRLVRTFTVNRAPHTVWDGKDELGQPLPSGAYFMRLDAGDQHASTRVVLQR